MGKRGREDALTSRVVFLPLLILSAFSSVAVAEFQGEPQIVNTFFDPKFHDDGSGGDSQAVESQFASSGVIRGSQEAYSFTTTAQHNPEDAYFSSSKPADPASQHKTAPPSVLFETGSFQEFHQVSPNNKEASVRDYGAGREISSSHNVVTEAKDEHISGPVASFTSRPQYAHHQHQGDDGVITTYHNSAPSSVSSLGESGGGSGAPEVIYAPDGWIPNTETFPDSDTTYAKPVSSSSVVKWPEEVGSYRDNGGDITPQLYDYVEPALRVPTTTTPRPVPIPISSQFHYATPIAPTTPQPHHPTNPLLGGYQFRVAHSPMLASIGNYVSSSVSSLFKSLPRLQLVPGGGQTLSQLVQQQQQPPPPQPTHQAQLVDYTSLSGGGGGYSGSQHVPPEPHSLVHQSYYHHYPAPPSGTSGSQGVISSDGGRLVSFPSLGGEGYGYAPSYKFIPTLGYSHGPPPPQPSFEYAPSYHPTPALVSHQTSAPPTSYGQGPPPTSYISGPKVTFKSEPSPQRPRGQVPPRTKSVKFPEISGRVPSLTKGSLSSLYSSAEDLTWDAFSDVGEDVALSALYDDGGLDYLGLGKPLKSYYSSPEEYYAILNDGGTADQGSTAHSGRPGSSSPSSPPVSVNYASGSPDYVSYGVSSHSPGSVRYALTSYGSIKAPGSTSDDFLHVHSSYGTPKDLRKPSTVGYYRTTGGSWARIPYIRGSPGYKYKYITTQQMPIMERDPLLLDLEDEADFYDGLNEGRLRDPDCENKRHCDERDVSTNEYRDIAENVQLTRRPNSSFTNAMFKKLMRNAVRQQGRRGHRDRRHRRGKGKRRRCGSGPKRCRKY